MRCAVVNLGCKVNRVEADHFEASLRQLGIEVSPEPDADFAIVNTCTVTAEAEKKSRKAVRRALADHPRASVVVTGCSAVINGDALAALDARVRVLGKADLESALSAACARHGGGALGGKAAPAHGHGPDLSALPFPEPIDGFSPSTASGQSGVAAMEGEGRLRRGIKVQDGCSNACTYCIVHVARGASRSASAASVAKECEALAKSGVPEIMLTGINLGAWRNDGPSGLQGLPHLVSLALEVLESSSDKGAGPFPRLRLGSIEPMDVDPGLVDLLAGSTGRLCRHLHLPLQSGSNAVLAAMERPYGAEHFLELVQRLRAQVPGISLSTDVIVGFPGETEEDFAETMALAQACGFAKIHVFPYSPREGTPAAEYRGQIPPEVKARRAGQLRELSAQLAERDFQSRRGRTEWALVERPGRARLESYHEISVDSAYGAGAALAVDPACCRRLGQ